MDRIFESLANASPTSQHNHPSIWKSKLRQQELKLMKRARKVHSQMGDKDLRKVVRCVIHALLANPVFDYDSVEAVVDFLPLFAWEHSLDSFAETLYVTARYETGVEYNSIAFTDIPLENKAKWGPDQDPLWSNNNAHDRPRANCRINADSIRLSLTRMEFYYDPNKMPFVWECPEGFALNGTSKFSNRYNRDLNQGGWTFSNLEVSIRSETKKHNDDKQKRHPLKTWFSKKFTKKRTR